MKFVDTIHSVTYKVTNSGNNWFDPSGYSKYYERLTLQQEGNMEEGEVVYGFEQALEHLQELETRNQYSPKCWIIKTTCVTESIVIHHK